MKTTHQHFLRIAAVLALSAASVSVFAQSGEYRRGYDEGFAAGQRAAHEGGGRPGGPRIHIEEAMYGARGAECDARRAVHDAVERNNGSVTASNQLCGDPARGAPKHLRIVYRCGDSRPASVTARENERLQLSCRR